MDLQEEKNGLEPMECDGLKFALFMEVANVAYLIVARS